MGGDVKERILPDVFKGTKGVLFKCESTVGGRECSAEREQRRNWSRTFLGRQRRTGGVMEEEKNKGRVVIGTLRAEYPFNSVFTQCSL